MEGEGTIFLLLWLITAFASTGLVVLYLRERRRRRGLNSAQDKAKEEESLKNHALDDLKRNNDEFRKFRRESELAKETATDEISRMETQMSHLMQELSQVRPTSYPQPGSMTPRCTTPRIMQPIGAAAEAGEASSVFPSEAGDDIPAMRQMLAYQCEKVERLQAAAKAHEEKIVILPQMQEMVREAHEMAQKYKEQRDIIDHEKTEIANKLSVEEDRVKLLCEIIQQLKSRMVDLCPPTPRPVQGSPIAYADLGEEARRLLDALPELSPQRIGCTPMSTPLDISISSDMFPRQSEETEPHSLNQYDFCGASESTAHANQMVPPLSFPQSATKAEHSLGTAPKPMEGSPNLARVESLTNEILFGLRGA